MEKITKSRLKRRGEHQFCMVSEIVAFLSYKVLTRDVCQTWWAGTRPRAAFCRAASGPAASGPPVGTQCRRGSSRSSWATPGESSHPPASLHPGVAASSPGICHIHKPYIHKPTEPVCQWSISIVEDQYSWNYLYM